MEFNFNLNRIIELDEVPSTQDAAKQLAETSGEDNVLIQARVQTLGRGRFERIWSSEHGGLYISLLLRPGRQVKSPADLSVKAGEAVAKTLEHYGIKTKIKLPNDVLALKNGSYKKIAGILIETSSAQDNLNWLIVGMGVNLNNDLPKCLEAIAVKEILKQEIDITEFRNLLVKNFAKSYLQWQMGRDI